ALLLSAPPPSAAVASKIRDPLLVLSGPRAAGLARRAALALTLDGPEGAKLLALGSDGRTLLANLVSWAEARAEHEVNGMILTAEPRGRDELEIELRA